MQNFLSHATSHSTLTSVLQKVGVKLIKITLKFNFNEKIYKTRWRQYLGKGLSIEIQIKTIEYTII